MSSLPDKPSELIRLALSDLAKCEQDPRYKIDMCEWHTPALGVCHVCLAGSVIAQSLGKNYTEEVVPALCVKEADKLRALNSFRTGDIYNGLSWMDIRKPENIQHEVKICYYNTNAAQFSADMLALADMLEKEGL